MFNKNDKSILITKMTDNVNSNIKKIRKSFGSLSYTDDRNQSILHILVDDKYDESKCFLAIKSLLHIGFSPNLTDDYNYNFIQTALYAGYSEEFILNIINEALKYNLNVNHVDGDNDTIMHTAIYSEDYFGGVEKIYDLLCANGFDTTLQDCEGRNLFEAMMFEKNYEIENSCQKKERFKREKIESFKKKFEERNLELQNNNEFNELKFDGSTESMKQQTNTANVLTDKDILELEKYGKVLTNKNYITSPTIGREKELKNLMITLAQDKKRPLIVGESGVGKTSIVEELAYRIKTNQVPSFLQNKIILDVNPSEVVAGCQYVGTFEDAMTKLMKLCEQLDIIVFIDEIHTIYGIGSSKGKDNDMSSMLKYYIDRSNLKVIGTTTEKEYNEFFSQDALKRRFEKVEIKEPLPKILYQIIDKVIGDYYIKTGITFENENIKKEIVNIIMSATEKKHIVNDDMINNPDLSISIIDKAFAFAKVYDSEFITPEHFIESFECCNRIYQTTIKQAIEKIKNLDISISKPLQKVLKIDFNASKK